MNVNYKLFIFLCNYDIINVLVVEKGAEYMNKFELVSSYKPTGDQPKAIEKLVKSIQEGNREQTLLGITGSGKTFTMAKYLANIIQDF